MFGAMEYGAVVCGLVLILTSLVMVFAETNLPRYIRSLLRKQ